MRMTSQRVLMLDYLKSVKTHPTAMEIYKEMRRKLPHISFGTVYRNLNYLREQGLIQELKYSAGSRFDGNAATHYHFLCRVCGKVDDMAMEPLGELESGAKKISGFEIESHQVQFVGQCQECRKIGGRDGNKGKP